MMVWRRTIVLLWVVVRRRAFLQCSTRLAFTGRHAEAAVARRGGSRCGLVWLYRWLHGQPYGSNGRMLRTLLAVLSVSRNERPRLGDP